MNILFFGDSNTWGYQGDNITCRMPFEKRFTGMIAHIFPEHRIIEEGLPGRTICMNDPLNDCRNGMKALPMILQTHEPVDLVIIMLGTNDTKIMFGHTAITIRMAMENMIQFIQCTDHWSVTGKQPQIMLVSPPSMGDIRLSSYYGMFDENSVAMISQISSQFKDLAKAYQCLFVDGSVVTAEQCSDHVHLTESEHAALGKLIADCIRKNI